MRKMPKSMSRIERILHVLEKNKRPMTAQEIYEAMPFNNSASYVAKTLDDMIVTNRINKIKIDNINHYEYV